MKKIDSLLAALTVLYVILPVSRILLVCFGFSVEFNEIFLMIMLGLYVAVSVAFAVAICRTKEKVNGALCTLLAVFQIFTWGSLLYQKWINLSIGTIISIAMLISFICVIVITVHCVQRKKTVGILMSLMGIVLFVLSGFFSVFWSIGISEVKDTCTSPEGKFRAEVVQINQGALGGDTVVYAYDCEKELDLHFAKVFRTPETVYVGEFFDCDKMEIKWMNYDTLLINGKEYNIKHPSFV